MSGSSDPRTSERAAADATRPTDSHSNSTTMSRTSTVPGDRASLLRRRWPIVLAAVVALALAVWALSRRGAAEASGAKEGAAASTAPDTLLTLDSTAQRLAGVELLTLTPSGAGALTANGTITYDANRSAVVSSRSEGRVVSVRADLGQSVAAGAVLAIVESQDVGQTRGDLARARANLDVARRNYEREQRLFAQSITPQKELLEAEGAFKSAEADYASAASRLQAVGATSGQGATFALTAPVGGVVVERTVSPGQVVGPETNLFTVADLRHLWITTDVYENDLPRVHQGATARVVPSALPGETFTGRVTYAGGVVDPQSRTFKVRVEVDNLGLRLRPGMFAQVQIEGIALAPAPGVAATILVPEIAVQEVGGKQIVFVAGSAPGQFIVRPVTVGARGGNGQVTITAGLRAGERVVTRGAFQLKSELTKASFAEED